MSITRLQQARQMYATGQRVAKTLDGSRPGYRGDDAARSERSYSGGNKSARADPGPSAGYQGDGPSSSDRDNNTREDNNPFNTAPPQTATNLDVREQYAVNNPTTLGAPIAPPTVSPFFENNRKDNYIDAFNLSNSTYKPVNIPPFIPGSTLINTAGNFLGNLGYKKNTKFFADNVAGKYGYGYGIEDYQQYMQDRMSGKVGAYGNEEQGQNALSGQGGGIMDIYNLVNATDTDTDTDTDTEKFVSRFLQNRTPEERAAIEEQYQNYYTV